MGTRENGNSLLTRRLLPTRPFALDPQRASPMVEHSLRIWRSQEPPGYWPPPLPRPLKAISPMPSVSPISLPSEPPLKTIPTPGPNRTTSSLDLLKPLPRKKRPSRRPRTPRTPPFSHARSPPTTSTEPPWKPRWFNVLTISRPSRPSLRPRPPQPQELLVPDVRKPSPTVPTDQPEVRRPVPRDSAAVLLESGWTPVTMEPMPPGV